MLVYVGAVNAGDVDAAPVILVIICNANVHSSVASDMQYNSQKAHPMQIVHIYN